jgi:hypothetical protein
MLPWSLNWLAPLLASGPPPPPAPESYWKLNSSILSEPDFGQRFSEAWQALCNDRPVGVPASTWWEDHAKPFFRDFCQRFAKMVAHRRRETRNFLQLALGAALEAEDWARVRGCRARMEEMDRAMLRGKSVRAGVSPAPGGHKDPLFLEGAERRRRGIESIRKKDGSVLTEPAELEAEVVRYFEALFQGRHGGGGVGGQGPVDSGSPFLPNFARLGDFLQGLPVLSASDRDLLDLPVNIPDLERAVAAASVGRSPGLDGLSYKFYRAVLGWVGPAMADGLNSMLEQGHLSPSLCQGTVRLIPKVNGVPAASQLRPITLLNTDYKILTKVYVERLVQVLPSILQSGQLCSISGRNIMQGAVALWSTVEFVRHRKNRIFLLNLDFYHAYDRVCLAYVDRVLAAMGFGDTFREVVATLHRGATASFLLHCITPAVSITFSIRQGDPIAMLLYNIQLQPYLLRLEEVLPGVAFPDFEERVEAYVDDVVTLGEDENDLLTIDTITRQFEDLSGSILNRSHKTAILDLGGWAGRRQWPLEWVSAPQQLKTFGITFSPSLGSTVNLSWEDFLAGVQKAIHAWRERHVPFLWGRREVLETHILSKLWYMAQILPLPPAVAAKATSLAGSFLWLGHMERLAWQELHGRREAGGLGLSCITSRGEALLAKQFCHQIAAGGPPAGHLAFWLGGRVGHLAPPFAEGHHASALPRPLVRIAEVLEEVFAFGTVSADNPGTATAAGIYRAFMVTPPPPQG